MFSRAGLTRERLARLAEVSERLRERGQRDLADQLLEILSELRRSAPFIPEEAEFMTTGEAAALLGVRSVNTIKRWAGVGLLEGYRRGGRVLVTRASVERMRATPTLSHQLAYERDLDEVLSAFDSDEDPPPTELTWRGRKPWEEDGEGQG